MPRVLTTLLAVALVVMTSQGLPGMMQVREACAASQSCCPDSEDSHEAPPATPVCVQCCLMCCAVVSIGMEGVASPGMRIEKWRIADCRREGRTEEPPVPPPRVS